MTKLQTLLKKQIACPRAINWVGDRNLETAWRECERADWMLWLCGRMQGTDGWSTRQEIVLTACNCAESVLEIFEKKYPHDKDPRNAIATARAWAKGKASIEEVRSASFAASSSGDTAACTAAAYAAYATYAAAYTATYAADTAAYAADTAAYAADAAAYAAADAADAARNKKLKALADLVRKQLKVPNLSNHR